eukprot:4205835-Alexandrium_andersonii.AAC.1
MNNQPGQRSVQHMVLVGAAQSAAAGGVVDHGPAIPSDGDPGPGNGSLQQQLNRQPGSTRLSHDC